MSVQRQYYRVLSVSRDDIASVDEGFKVGSRTLPKKYSRLSDSFMKRFSERLGKAIMSSIDWDTMIREIWEETKESKYED